MYAPEALKFLCVDQIHDQALCRIAAIEHNVLMNRVKVCSFVLHLTASLALLGVGDGKGWYYQRYSRT